VLELVGDDLLVSDFFRVVGNSIIGSTTKVSSAKSKLRLTRVVTYKVTSGVVVEM